MDFTLLKTICAIPSTAGDEGRMRDFLLNYFSEHKNNFKAKPTVYSGDEFQDMVIVVFGKPRTAIFAHTDTVAFMAGYDKELVKIGNPKAKAGSKLVGEDSKGAIKCTLVIPKKKKKKKKKSDQDRFEHNYKRNIDPGTPLTYAPDFKEAKHFVQSAYLDNRLGVWNAIQQAHTMENGALVFSTYEEHGGGGAQTAGKFLQDKYKVRQALISDVTLLSDHIKHKKGVAISIRDRGIPRQSYVRKMLHWQKRMMYNFS